MRRNFQFVRIGDIASAVSGRAYSTTTLPVYSVTKHQGFVKSSSYFHKQVYSSDLSNYRIVRRGHFAYATIHLDEGSIGYASEDCLISPMYTVFSIDSNKVDSSFLLRILKSKEIIAKYEMLGKGSVHRRRAISFDRLQTLEIPLPDLPEQRRIAAILDEADALRCNRQESLRQLGKLASALFAELFGSPDANPRKLRAVEFGDLIADGPTNGLYKPAHEYGEGTPILRINSFYDGRIIDIEKFRRLKISEREANVYGLSEGDIVVNRVNSRELLGKSALIPRLPERVVFESNMMRIRLDRARIHPSYCIAFLQTDFVKRQIGQKAKDAVNQSSINQADVKSLKMLLPSLSDQTSFALRVSMIEDVQDAHRAQLAEFDALFASLQHRAFRGEL